MVSMTRRALPAAILSFAVSCSSPGETPASPDESPGVVPTATGTAPPPPPTHNPDPPAPPPAGPWNPPVETGPVTFPYTAYRCNYPVRQISPSKPAATFHAAASGAAPTPRNLHLTIAGDAASSVVVQWSTDAATQATEVRFGDTPGKLDKIAYGYSFTYGVANRRGHEVHLCGLEPGRTFYYDAGGAGGRSKIYKVTTAPSSPADVKVLVGGDTRTNPEIWAGIATVAIAHGATALVMTGDAVLAGGVQSQWDALFEGAPDLFAQLPGIWTHGNHESLDELYFAQLALPDNGTAAGNEEWFATTYGPIRFIVLNDTVASNASILGTERTFLDTTLAAVDRTRTPFVVAMHHQPPYTTSTGHDPALDLRAAWVPLYDQHHVNAVLNGHVHSYESTMPLRAGLVTTDALGTRYLVFGGGGADLYGFKAMQPIISKRESVHGFALMSGSATEMKWTAYRADDSVIETITMPK